MSEYLVIALIAASAAFVQSSVGFGYALVFAPLAAFIIDPSDAIAASIVGGTIIAVVLYLEYTPRTPVRAIAPMALPAIAAVPAGLWLLAVADEEFLRLLIGGGVFLSAAVNLRHPTHNGPPRADRLTWQVVVGALSGVMRGAVSMGGPPIILYQHWIGGGAGAIRSRMFAFFLWTAFPAVLMAAGGGIIDREAWLYALAAVAGLPAGIAAGKLLRPVISEAVFARLSMGLLGGTAGVAAIGATLAIVG